MVTIFIVKEAYVQDVPDQLYQMYPSLTSIKSILIAVNGEYADREQLRGSKDELALISPVSGG